ncbi:MAG TPA: tyrosine-type recombinase/integrase [Solirubrobacterales bacterium]|nr:tyrosine-type recombinase/integrase [Solirubrobacterales bacterium]
MNANFPHLVIAIVSDWTGVIAAAAAVVGLIFVGVQSRRATAVARAQATIQFQNAFRDSSGPRRRIQQSFPIHVPLVAPLRALLSGEWVAQDRPRSGRVCPPKRIRKSGRKSMRSLQRRVRHRWQAQGLEPIGLHEARHTAATWLDHAGVSAKVCSQIMGHKTPEYQPGAARITLERYTHVLPGELEHARERLNRFLSERT